MSSVTHVQHLRGTSDQNNAYTGLAGEITVDTTNNALRVHDGTTVGGHEISSITSLPKASKTTFGVVKIGAGLEIEDGVLSLVFVSKPTILTPLSGGTFITYEGIDITVTPYSGAVRYDSTDYYIYADAAMTQLVAQETDTSAHTSHRFTNLSGLTGGQEYFLFVRHNGAYGFSSAFSDPVSFIADNGTITPTHRTVYRHPTLPGSVIVYNDLSGATKRLFVADARYRGWRDWSPHLTDLTGLNNWSHNYYSTSTSNALDDSVGSVDLSTVVSLSVTASKLGDARYQQALQSSLGPVLQTAKAATDIMVADYSSSAAGNARAHSSQVGIELQVPNIYQLLVIYAEADYIDSLDESLQSSSYSDFAIGWNATAGKRWRALNSTAAWSSTEANANFACIVFSDGHSGIRRKDTNGGAVIPVAELD